MEFSKEMIDHGATRLFTLKTDDEAVTLMLFPREFSGTNGIIAHHVKSDGGAAMECDIFGRCCARDRRIMTDHPVNAMSDEDIRTFLEAKIKSGV